MTLLAFMLAASANASPAEVVTEFLNSVRADDRAAYSRLAPDLQWEIPGGLKLHADFEDVSLFAKGCDPFVFGEPQAAGRDGSVRVGAAMVCRAKGPHPLAFEFVVRDGTVLSYLVKEAN